MPKVYWFNALWLS